LIVLQEHRCNSRREASQLAAGRIAKRLRLDLDSQSEASMVVSGGSTPKGCFRILAGTALPWDRVHVVPSDERWVPAEDAASNEKMIRETLLVNRASGALLHPLYAGGTSAQEHCATLSNELDTLPLLFSSVLLGMGEDGHFASLFPDIAELDDGLDMDSNSRCLAIVTKASPHERITLTLSTLTRSKEILLLIFGAAKREVVQQAKLFGDTHPVSRLLRQQRTPVHVIWAT
jgi:6-phosphogluconolactonase